MEHKLSLNEIVSLLEENGVTVSDRKTLYEDFKVLNEMGYEIEYDNGYYLTEAPFSLSEIKIIIDSLNSLKNLDDTFLNRLKKKLYSFISEYEADLLKKLEYHSKHKDRKFINRLEDTLEAIRNGKMLQIKRSNHDEKETIAPLFLYRENDYYYLYYHYENNGKIYHARFDNIIEMKLLNRNDELNISTSSVISQIKESSNAFYSDKAKLIRFEIIHDSDYLKDRIRDDFPEAIFTKDGFTTKASISDAFFSKLVSYSDNIKISDQEIADQYIEFLNKIIIRNSKDRNNN